MSVDAVTLSFALLAVLAQVAVVSAVALRAAAPFFPLAERLRDEAVARVSSVAHGLDHRQPEPGKLPALGLARRGGLARIGPRRRRRQQRRHRRRLSSFPYFVALDEDGRVSARTSGELSTDQLDALAEATTSPAG